TDAATLGHVLSHEYQHVRYKDALINIAWLVALCAHWFNPLAWAGWFFLRRDMETRCDAGAIKRLGANYIKSYANALLEMAPVRKAHALPLAFGSTSLNERIERVVAYRPAKRSAVIVATAMMLSFVSLFAVNPVRAAIAEQIVEPIMGQVVDIMELNGKITQPAAGEIRYSLFKLDIREFSQNQNSVFHTIVKSFESYEDAVSYIGEANPSADIGQIAKYSRSNNVLMRYRGTLNAIYESSFDFSFVGIAFGVETENNRDVFLLLDRASFTNRYDKRTPAVAIGLIQIVAFDNGPPQIIWL
ncbi:MAG: M56 family metallopeptidase, partial [Defluviitaleaceae bacterium]|nr:M56 family metallopeptidase [Defluviitaleaceae bacterium]